MVSNDDEAKLHIYEVYADAAAFEAHLNSSSIRQFREETAGMVAGIVVAKSTLAQ
ncbi:MULTISPECIES: antibiotic biosynthesis monooxygenase [unclassified Rhizobium]|uniref:putative quinol monooxygenase n=1 Tax=unclassified Rhizobium TaxID=2613769 RepID=UPI0018371079|nr:MULTISPECIES: antibiotic biosynthesis monooxygenase [unclassified Rhizobium]MBB3541756.1 quinol monooxygenase YgiN [Rhizobium sp. BK399]MCS3740664.1 quinol monooxygenase YgiN [Rhizobium sp. BK661]MCS4092500.1 quinol monooxygenase YgiN [Rhizobium sp. BK176]